jgi:hypothetical protein
MWVKLWISKVRRNGVGNPGTAENGTERRTKLRLFMNTSSISNYADCNHVCFITSVVGCPIKERFLGEISAGT